MQRFSGGAGRGLARQAGHTQVPEALNTSSAPPGGAIEDLRAEPEGEAITFKDLVLSFLIMCVHVGMYK